MPAHQLPQPRAALRIEARGDEPLVFLLFEEGGNASGLQVGERNTLHFRTLEQIVRTGRTLQPGAEDEHAHRDYASE